MGNAISATKEDDDTELPKSTMSMRESLDRSINKVGNDSVVVLTFAFLSFDFVLRISTRIFSFLCRLINSVIFDHLSTMAKVHRRWQRLPSIDFVVLSPALRVSKPISTFLRKINTLNARWVSSPVVVMLKVFLRDTHFCLISCCSCCSIEYLDVSYRL